MPSISFRFISAISGKKSSINVDLISIPSGHIKKTTSFEKKPLVLKDYLLRDDLSSCSSNGFKSFPRQQCCTTVRFLLEAELKKSEVIYSATTKPSTTTVSAVQRASHAVLKAVKLLPFPSIKSSSSSLKRNSSRKTHFTRRVSSNASSNSWAETETESEFTTDVSQSWSGNSESSSENDVVEGETNLPNKQKISNDWPKEERKEQLSPVSVLDFPFHDEEDNPSHFEDGSPHVEAGTKQKLMQKQKVRIFEGFTGQVEQVDLEKRIAMTKLQVDDTEANEKLLKALKVKTPSSLPPIIVAAAPCLFHHWSSLRTLVLASGVLGWPSSAMKSTRRAVSCCCHCSAAWVL
ncbi:hypothetical protein F3Y22_tig00004797pilonHSYRG00167 [Hibiscus syriacus]|uniref:Uncharacterized protein n=1 Tax=Hibiscus syriacus TaxID=106335 RepID=A0A6A3CLC4_HIBSY|nr:hypothetical protein F3Y22_tig00004797pilonHSYRG00167 [Hibiscus syriacus]